MVKKIVFIIIPIILTVSHLSSKLQLWHRSRQGIKKLETQISQLSQEKLNLEKKRDYYHSDEFIKRAARENLGLIGPDEKVLILPLLPENEQNQIKSEKISSLPTYKQWFLLFFN